MVMELYKISRQVRELVEQWESRLFDKETGEILEGVDFDLEEFNKLEMEETKKLEDLVCYLKEVRGLINTLKGEEQELAKRRRALENEEQRLKGCVTYVANGRKYKTPRMAISYKRTPSVMVNDMKALIEFDDNLVRYPDPEPRKREIQNLLKTKDVPGCEIVYSTSTIIK